MYRVMRTKLTPGAGVVDGGIGEGLCAHMQKKTISSLEKNMRVRFLCAWYGSHCVPA